MGTTSTTSPTPTELIHYAARYYNPTTAAWTQLDPTGQSFGYTYAADNPINFNDPSDLCTFGVIGFDCSVYSTLSKATAAASRDGLAGLAGGYATGFLAEGVGCVPGAFIGGVGGAVTGFVGSLLGAC